MPAEPSTDTDYEVQQFSTFTVDHRLFGIPVKQVQEVVKAMAMTRIPLAPPHVSGLINLRGQVATAIGIRELFKLPPRNALDLMNVVCRTDSALLSFQVDLIGDVIEVRQADFERTPTIIPLDIRRFLGGVYKVQGALLSIIDTQAVSTFLGITGRQLTA